MMTQRDDILPRWTWLHAVVFWCLSTFLRRKVRRHLAALSGAQHVPDAGPLILIANHESYFDTFVICVLMRELYGRRVWVPTKVKAFKGHLRRLFHEAGGAIAIDQAQPDDAYRKISALLARGEWVLVFPEGRRRSGAGLLPFNYGGFNLAVQAGVPILPIALHGTARVLPNLGLSFVPGAKAYVEIGARLVPQRFRNAGEEGGERDSEKATAGRMRDHTRAWIEERLANFAPPKEDELALSAMRLARVMEQRVEALLEQGIEKVTRRAALTVLRGCELAFELGIRSLPLEVQYTRLFGFSILGLPKVVALLFIGEYRRLIQNGLALQSDNPYLHYCLGQLQYRAPRLLGGDRTGAVKSFEMAYRAAPWYGFDAAKFVVSLATALAKVGRAADAKALLTQHFATQPSPDATERERRRYQRARLLAEQLRFDVDSARTLNPVGTP